ncbi:tRNA (N6-threonylcarbamoyladenosine(37)-N6)-methyltransferase TrmO [Anaeroselena agilis]|uniref:tRNA (N6-threonylcarbamoyladenosine(37)-N6)-methyltransferase TrmO n=1 Tax=Anaeroselena agilis TaxID=3063788 RepID=A0ABU3NSH2_9FIRM|nr:tRNA (N6-threonylcarbamoyladenosine(37)-N6)-methyltransferase TrmO [Selenomonadales bacterium 4137-cl]
MNDHSFTQVTDIRPVGHVDSRCGKVEDMPLGGLQAMIRLAPDFQPALLRISEHSHIWVLTWFHQADRSVLRVRPSKVNPDLPEYGIFAIRCSSRPNPIALTLVTLDKVDGCDLYVTGLDAVDGTPVLDIKPYYGDDIVFSPLTPHIPARDLTARAANLRKLALRHHGEACLGLELGVRIALLAEEHFGQLHSPALTVAVEGDPCLADVLQGLTRARLANPPRFSYMASPGAGSVMWAQNGRTLRIDIRPDVDLALARSASPAELFRLGAETAPGGER